jgi:hypothetical protein
MCCHFIGPGYPHTSRDFPQLLRIQSEFWDTSWNIITGFPDFVHRMVGWLVHPCGFHLEHKAFVKRFVSLQFLNLWHLVGLLGRVISPSQGRYLTQMNIHVSNGIRTHDPSVSTSEDSSYLRSSGHSDRLSIVWCSKKNSEIQRFGNCTCFRPQVIGETHILLGPLERANLKHWIQNHLESVCYKIHTKRNAVAVLTWIVQWLTLALSKGPFRVGVSPSLKDGNRSSFLNIVFSSFQNTVRWTKSKNPVILSVIHDRQNALESISWNRPEPQSLKSVHINTCRWNSVIK